MSEAQCIKKLYQLTESSSVENFQQQALEEFQKMIQFDSAGWGEIAMAQGSIFVLRAYLYNQPSEYSEDYNKVQHLNPSGPELTLGNITTRTTMADVNNNEYEIDDKFKAFIYKYDVQKVLQTATRHKSSLFMYSIGLWRKGSNSPFSEEERLLKERLTPYLLDSYRHCRRFDIQRKLLKRWELNRGLATCNEEGILYDADDFFVELLKQDWPDWQSARLPDRLLQTLMKFNVVKTDNHFYRYTLLDNLYLLVGSRLGTLEKLSKREFQIAFIYSNGSTSKEIANQLSISPVTVKNHVAKIYGKLDLDSKDKLKLLFANNE